MKGKTSCGVDCEQGFRIERLTCKDRESARQTFALMADVFGEECLQLSNRYLDRLLNQADFWTIAAFDKNNEVIGGLTAHIISKTTSESSELFIYDLAVRRSRQRQGVGRLLIGALRDNAVAAGIQEIFVVADNADIHALDFYRALGGKASQATLFTFSIDRRT